MTRKVRQLSRYPVAPFAKRPVPRCQMWVAERIAWGSESGEEPEGQRSDSID